VVFVGVDFGVYAVAVGWDEDAVDVHGWDDGLRGVGDGEAGGHPLAEIHQFPGPDGIDADVVAVGVVDCGACVVVVRHWDFSWSDYGD